MSSMYINNKGRKPCYQGDGYHGDGYQVWISVIYVDKIRDKLTSHRMEVSKASFVSSMTDKLVLNYCMLLHVLVP